jgi:hypothetical protein
MTARTSASSSQRTTASISSPDSMALSEFAESGRFRVTCATPSRVSKEIVVYGLTAWLLSGYLRASQTGAGSS